jgi:3-methyladenine DNA glycosylase/8-oxoguanine DNA glycosylase
MRTEAGPATLAVHAGATAVEVEAWGPGARSAIDGAPRLLGFEDEPAAFTPADAFMADLHRRHRGLRIGATGSVVDALVPAILEQKVTTVEAHRSWRRLVRAHGEPAPGPLPDLRLPPEPRRLARLGYADFHPLGVERRRAEVIRTVCKRAHRLDALRHRPAAEARRILELLPGIGPWTSAVVTLRSHGDPDAVIVGDYNLPNLVTFSLTGERDGTDDRMLELLEPYRGQRARAQLLLKRGGTSPPRRAPRARLRDLSRI